jgi:UDP-N-acetylmuramate--alanine ligase
VPLADAFAALEGFTGAGRRFEVVGTAFGYTVVDDYAHHPTELRAAIAAARSRDPQRLVVLFQPHMPWRATRFAEEFADALKAADRVVVLETYVARGEVDPDQGSALPIAQMVGSQAVFVATGRAAADELRGIARSGDLILCCGAGPVDRVARAVLA